MYGGRRIEMNKKNALTVFASICITLFLIQFYVCVESKSAGGVDNLEDSTEKMSWNTAILNQTFDAERVGDVPKNWTITEPKYGSFTIDNQTWYSGGKSARFVDNSTVGSPRPYMTFPPQNGTIAVTFAIRLNASSGINTNLSIWVDDGNFAGSNIYFTNKSTTEYRDDEGFHVLCNYTVKEWYEIKMIMNIPDNKYEIYIDDIRIIRNATFYNFNVSREIRRIVFGEALDLEPIGHIDNIVIERIGSIRVPEDYSRIQEAIDMASPGITIRVASSDRPYYEYIHIRNKHDLCLKGDIRSTTIIDGRFEGADMDVILIDEYSYNVTISGFTIRKGGRSGISISGSNNTILDNIISNNTIGVNCIANGGNTFHRNNFICNTQQAVDEGPNKWDNNYWSNYTGVDEFSGPGQDKPGPDGIGDTPHFIPLDNKDNYPLFLIQNASRNPDKPSYDEKVNITATILDDVQIDKAILNFSCDYGRTWESINMTIRSNKCNATIRGLPYNGTVYYKIHAKAVRGEWIVSANFSYTVTDTVPPKIPDVKRTPEAPYPNQTVTIIANVSEPENASGVGEVLLYHKVDDSSLWSANMNLSRQWNATLSQWNATIPTYTAGANVSYYVRAFDKARYGNNSTRTPSFNYTVKSLPEPPKLCIKIDSLDFGIMSERNKTLKFEIGNCGGGTLTWEITITRGDPWLNATPISGKVESGKTVAVNVTVNVTYVVGMNSFGYNTGELSVTSGGGNKTVPVYVLVTRIIIDNAMVSDDRCDVNSTQTIYFHAIWANNHSAVQNGIINVTCIDYTTGATDLAIHMINATGWISFTNSSLMVGSRTWMVTGVNCSGITSYVQEALNPSIIWDRVSIILAIQNDRIRVGENATITWSGTYKSDGTVFSGSLTLNDTRTQHTTPGERGYITLSMLDPVYGLEALTSNSITCTWEEILFWTQWEFLMVVAVVTAMGGGILTTLAFWTRRVYKKS
jgi:hypothetical protein